MNAFTHLQSEDLRAMPKPLFPVEPKDKDPASEVSRQAQFRDMLRFSARGFMTHSVPNAGKRGPKAIVRAKKEGLTSGAFDEEYKAYGAWDAYLEWKDGKGDLTREQILWGNGMLDRGFRVACVRSPDFALELFRGWGAPLLDRVDRL